MTSRVDNLYVQNNILITQDDQACLADFGIVDAFRDHTHHSYQPGATRYMAPERLLNYLPPTNKLSTESDVYSLAMTSFEVCSPATNHPTT